MALRFTNLQEALSHGFDTLIDVRSPAEYAEDCMPGAMNCPVLSDEERARVGTIYVQESPFRARKVGAALVARNAAAHIETVFADKDGGWRPLVYCWRGGQRSGSFAAILREIGWRVETVEGGYQSWRRLVVHTLYKEAFPARVVLLDGNTGTGKTELLARLSNRGCQVIDLEGLANHRGSLLGAVGQQPSQKAFESALAVAVAGLDPSRPVVIEAESPKIGGLLVPPGLVAAMKAAQRMEVTAPLEARAAYLVRAYRDVARDRAAFADRVRSLKRLRGVARVERWAQMVLAGEGEAVAMDLMAEHYDPAYAKSRAKHREGPVQVFEADRLEDADLDDLADRMTTALRSP